MNKDQHFKRNDTLGDPIQKNDTLGDPIQGNDTLGDPIQRNDTKWIFGTLQGCKTAMK